MYNFSKNVLINNTLFSLYFIKANILVKSVAMQDADKLVKVMTMTSL